MTIQCLGADALEAIFNRAWQDAGHVGRRAAPGVRG
jgi:hypothetical protein